MIIDCQERILLTGAGFTKNFGGPLAREVWSIIFNNPILDNAPEAREVLRRNFDFESVFNEVMNGARLPAEIIGETEPAWGVQQQALRTAISEVYQYIDDKVRNWVFRSDAPYAVNIYKVQDLIAAFAGSKTKPGFFFTLNQDLFVERHYYNGPTPSLPGITRRPSWFVPNSSAPLSAEKVVLPPSGNDVASYITPFNYVKLHGSSNWYSADQQTMVIGHAKRDQIAARPILARYYEIFQAALTVSNRRLLCIGYSFMDEHINAAILEGIKKGLRLYVLTPEAPDALGERLNKQGEPGALIWRGLSRYFQIDLKTMFPPDQSVTAEWKQLESQFFQS